MRAFWHSTYEYSEKQKCVIDRKFVHDMIILYKKNQQHQSHIVILCQYLLEYCCPISHRPQVGMLISAEKLYVVNMKANLIYLALYY